MKTIFSEEFTLNVIVDGVAVEVEFVIHGHCNYHTFKTYGSNFRKDVRKLLRHYKNRRVIFKHEYIDNYRLGEVFIVDDGEEKMISLLRHIFSVIVSFGETYNINVLSLHSKHGVIKNH